MPPWSAAAARVLMIGLPGPTLSQAELERVQALRPGGAILFARNLVTPEQTRELVRTLRGALAEPGWIALDQEGGRVSRLEPFIGPTPPASEWAARGANAARRFGQETAHALRSLGFNFDFAPVVDLCEPAATNGIGDRSFGLDPETVVTAAGAFLDGLQSGGVAACLKHFPGLGWTDVDSHAELPRCDRSLEELSRLDIEPYRRLGPGAASVMVGHGYYPCLETGGPTPATASRQVIDLLRVELGFEGLVVSDDLEMGAVGARDTLGSFATRALSAGCDLLLYCHEIERAEGAATRMTELAREEPAFAERLQRAARRVEETAREWPLNSVHDRSES